MAALAVDTVEAAWDGVLRVVLRAWHGLHTALLPMVSCMWCMEAAVDEVKLFDPESKTACIGIATVFTRVLHAYDRIAAVQGAAEYLYCSSTEEVYVRVGRQTYTLAESRLQADPSTNPATHLLFRRRLHAEKTHNVKLPTRMKFNWERAWPMVTDRVFKATLKTMKARRMKTIGARQAQFASTCMAIHKNFEDTWPALAADEFPASMQKKQRWIEEEERWYADNDAVVTELFKKFSKYKYGKENTKDSTKSKADQKAERMDSDEDDNEDEEEDEDEDEEEEEDKEDEEEKEKKPKRSVKVKKTVKPSVVNKKPSAKPGKVTCEEEEKKKKKKRGGNTSDEDEEEMEDEEDQYGGTSRQGGSGAKSTEVKKTVKRSVVNKKPPAKSGKVTCEEEEKKKKKKRGGNTSDGDEEEMEMEMDKDQVGGTSGQGGSGAKSTEGKKTVKRSVVTKKPPAKSTPWNRTQPTKTVEKKVEEAKGEKKKVEEAKGSATPLTEKRPPSKREELKYRSAALASAAERREAAMKAEEEAAIAEEAEKAAEADAERRKQDREKAELDREKKKEEKEKEKEEKKAVEKEKKAAEKVKKAADKAARAEAAKAATAMDAIAERQRKEDEEREKEEKEKGNSTSSQTPAQGGIIADMFQSSRASKEAEQRRLRALLAKKKAEKTEKKRMQAKQREAIDEMELLDQALVGYVSNLSNRRIKTSDGRKSASGVSRTLPQTPITQKEHKHAIGLDANLTTPLDEMERDIECISLFGGAPYNTYVVPDISEAEASAPVANNAVYAGGKGTAAAEFTIVENSATTPPAKITMLLDRALKHNDAYGETEHKEAMETLRKVKATDLILADCDEGPDTGVLRYLLSRKYVTTCLRKQ